MKKIIVFDSPYSIARENHCFDQSLEFKGNGAALVVRLAREARNYGFEILTSDVFLSKIDNKSRAICISEMVSPFTNELLKANVSPTICFSLESPIVAPRFYHNIKRYAGRFTYNYQFLGIHKKLESTNTIVNNLVFPVETRKPEPIVKWAARKYLVLVNSNKRAIVYNFHNPKVTLTSMAINARNRIWKIIDPYLQIRELYKDRIKAIFFFSDNPGFNLYGKGWDEPIYGFSNIYSNAARKRYIGKIAEGKKKEVIGKYKFCLCFENTIFPGYITEKMIDCFLAGCIPIYWGAPDINDFVPKESFIDYRDFASFYELDTYLTNLTEVEAMKYIEAARDFLSSKSFDRFDMNILLKEWIDLINTDLNN